MRGYTWLSTSCKLSYRSALNCAQWGINFMIFCEVALKQCEQNCRNKLIWVDERHYKSFQRRFRNISPWSIQVINIQLPIKIHNIMLTVAQRPGADAGTGQICAAASRPHPALVFVSGFQLAQVHTGGVWRELKLPHSSRSSNLLTHDLVSPGILSRSHVPRQGQRGLIDGGQFHTHGQLWGQTTGTLMSHHLVNVRCG